MPRKTETPDAEDTILLAIGDAALTHPAVQTFLLGGVGDKRKAGGKKSREHDESQATAQLSKSDKLEWNDETATQIEQRLLQIGMFEQGVSIWVKNFTSDSSDRTDRLIDVLTGGLPKGSRIALSAEKIDQRTRAFKWFTKNARLEDKRIATDKTGQYDRDALAQFVMSRVREFGGIKTTQGAIRAIAERAEGSIGTIAMDIDRLCTAALGRGKLDEKLVAEHLEARNTAWVFDLTDAIGRRDTSRAALLVETLLAQGEVPLRLLATLSTHLAKLAAARRVLDRTAAADLSSQAAFARRTFPALDDQVRQAFANNGFRAWYTFEAAARFDSDELTRVHGAVLRADKSLKSSPVAGRFVMHDLVTHACAPKPRSRASLS